MLTIIAFGHGLSYTSFEWSTAKISSSSSSHQISLSVSNNGKVAGQDVIQVYVSQGTEEPRKLEAFAKTEMIQPGSSEEITISLESRAFERWMDDSWRVPSGTWRVSLCRNVAEEVSGFDVAL